MLGFSLLLKTISRCWEIKPRASRMLGKHSTTALNLQLFVFFFLINRQLHFTYEEVRLSDGKRIARDQRTSHKDIISKFSHIHSNSSESFFPILMAAVMVQIFRFLTSQLIFLLVSISIALLHYHQDFPRLPS
jgi:hypothetical protein